MTRPEGRRQGGRNLTAAAVEQRSQPTGSQPTGSQHWPAPASFSGDPLLPPLGPPRFTNSCDPSPRPLECRSPSQLPHCGNWLVCRSRTLAEFLFRQGGANERPNIPHLLDFGSGWRFVVWRSRGRGGRLGLPGGQRTAEVRGRIAAPPLDRGFCCQPIVTLPLRSAWGPLRFELTLQL